MSEEKILAHLAEGKELHIEDQYYLHIIRKDGNGFRVEARPALGSEENPATRRCGSLVAALFWVIGEENITWK